MFERKLDLYNLLQFRFEVGNGQLTLPWINPSGLLLLIISFAKHIFILARTITVKVLK